MTRIVRSTLLLLGACALVFPLVGRAEPGQGPLVPFSRSAFDAARDAGRTTLVFFHAPWCSVCKAQEPKVVARLTGPARHVVAFKVDYDANSALRKEMNVAKQSTLVLFKGTTEVARLSYKSDDASMEEFFEHAAPSMPMGQAR